MNAASPTPKVLALGRDPAIVLAVARSLGRAGIEVHVGWQPPGSIAISSRYVRQAYPLPEYRDDSTAWRDALLLHMRREHFSLLLPCDSAAIIALQSQRDALAAEGRVFSFPPRTFDILFDKLATDEFARKHEISIPEGRVVHELGELRDVVPALGLPLVLKPQHTYDRDNPRYKHTVAKANSPAAIEKYLAPMLRRGPALAQRNFIGVGMGVGVLMKSGEPMLLFQHERVHEPLYGGRSSYRRGVALDKRLVAESVRFLRALDFTGVAMVEFKVDPQTRKYVFIGVQAGFWGSLPLAVASGANFPLGLYQLLVDGQSRVAQRGSVGRYSRNWTDDLSWMNTNWRAGKTNPMLATRPVWRVCADFVANTIRGRESSDSFALDDPRPALTELSQIAGAVAARFGDSVRRRKFESPAAQRALAARARDVLRNARNVLFVCKGNICRSPFAERYFRKVKPEIATASAGYYPSSHRGSPPNAVTVAREWDVDLAQHRSQLLTRELIDEFDAICVFDYENYATVTRTYPDKAAQVVYLGPLAGAGAYVADPWGGDPQRFRECYRIISAAIDAAL